MKPRAGDVIVDSTGAHVEVVSVIGAHEFLAGLSEQQRSLHAPTLLRDSSAAACCAQGATTSGRERRNTDRAQHRDRRYVCAMRGE